MWQGGQFSSGGCFAAATTPAPARSRRLRRLPPRCVNRARPFWVWHRGLHAMLPEDRGNVFFEENRFPVALPCHSVRRNRDHDDGKERSQTAGGATAKSPVFCFSHGECQA